MPKIKGPGHTPEQYEETVMPQNPPSSVLQPEVRRATLWLYLGPLMVIAVVIGIVLLYFTTRDSAVDEPVEPTTGVVEEATPGGGKPDTPYDSTQEELEYRGGKR